MNESTVCRTCGGSLRSLVACQHPEVATCANLWAADTNRRQLEAAAPELADEFPWGCDLVEHLATALVAARRQVAIRTAEARRLLNGLCGTPYRDARERAPWLVEERPTPPG